MSNNINIRNTFQSAWKNLHGSKAPIWAILVITMLALLGINLIMFSLGRAFYHENDLPLIWISLITPIVVDIALGVFLAGVFMPAIKKLRGEPIHATTGFQYFNRALQMMTFMLIIGTMNSLMMYFMRKFSIANGHAINDLSIYLWLAILFAFLVRLLTYIAVPIIADSQNTAFRSIFISLHKTLPVLHKLFLIELSLVVLTLIVLLPLLAGVVVATLYGMKIGVGIIVLLGMIIAAVCCVWLVPFSLLIQAKVYLQLQD